MDVVCVQRRVVEFYKQSSDMGLYNGLGGWAQLGWNAVA